MAYRFEDLDVWQDAKEQCDRIGELLKRPAFRADRELSKQLNGAGISVMNNISEGFLRRNDNEFAQFLRIAAASNGEVRSCLYAAGSRNYLSSDESINDVARSNRIGKRIRRLHDSLDVRRGRGTAHLGPRTKN